MANRTLHGMYWLSGLYGLVFLLALAWGAKFDFDLGVTVVDRPALLREMIAKMHNAAFCTGMPEAYLALDGMRVIGQYRAGQSPFGYGRCETMMGYSPFMPVVGHRTVLSEDFWGWDRIDQLTALLHEAHHSYYRSALWLSSEEEAEHWAENSLERMLQWTHFRTWVFQTSRQP